MKSHVKSCFFLSIALLVMGSPARAAIDPNVVQKVLADVPADEDNFGYSVAVDGDTAVIGAWVFGSYEKGAAYVFRLAGGTWTQEARLLASVRNNNDEFGVSVALDGDTAVIGARRNDGSGSAYVFVRSGTEWTEQAKLKASDAAASDYFGQSVALDGDTAVIGAHGEDENGSFSGSVYVFTRSGTTWTQRTKLMTSDGEWPDAFGVCAALDGETAVFGAVNDDNNSGSVYVFVGSGATWTEQAKLTAADRADDDKFGVSVALDGDTVVIGARGDDDDGTDSGSAYVFTRSGTEWTQQAKLLPEDGAVSNSFGSAVALCGNNALIGAPGDDDDGVDSGSAYMFARSGAAWTQESKLIASADGSAGDAFGCSTALDANNAVVGAYLDDDNGLNNGSAYIFPNVVRGTSICIR